MNVKTDLSALKLKKSLEKSKEAVIGLLSQVKTIDLHLDLSEKKANIELTLK